MPTEETCYFKVFFIGDVRLMEFAVVRVFECNILQPFVLRNKAVANDLHLWLVWDGLEVRVEDGAFGV
jgi:hypothetical protein